MTTPVFSFRNVLIVSVGLRIALILYSEWHDARSLVKYTDVDYRVFTDAAQFVLQPSQNNRAQGPLLQWLGYDIPIGDPYTRHTYRYTPLLALLVTPNIFLHPSFGKYIFAACDIINGLLIYNLLIHHILPANGTAKPPEKRNSRSTPTIGSSQTKATLYTTMHLLNPMVFSISTRGSSESVLSLIVLLTLHAVTNERWTTAAVLLGLSTHWKIYPVIYGVSCVCLIGSLSSYTKQKERNCWMGWFKTLVNSCTIKFAAVSASTFGVLGVLCYAVWGYPFLYETYLYHLHRLDHRHNFSPYFYLTYLTYPSLNSSSPSPSTSCFNNHQFSLQTTIITILNSPLISFLPQLILSLGTGFLSLNPRNTRTHQTLKSDIPFTWFIQTSTFVLFNKVCTSQYFLWYLLFLPLLPNLQMSRSKAVSCVGVWTGVQGLWLSEAYKLEFLGQDVFLSLWFRGLIYVVGNAWVLVVIMQSYKA